MGIDDKDMKWSSHEELVRQIRAAGDSLRLTIISPCQSSPASSMHSLSISSSSTCSSSASSSPANASHDGRAISTSYSTLPSQFRYALWAARLGLVSVERLHLLSSSWALLVIEPLPSLQSKFFYACQVPLEHMVGTPSPGACRSYVPRVKMLFHLSKKSKQTAIAQCVQEPNGGFTFSTLKNLKQKRKSTTNLNARSPSSSTDSSGSAWSLRSLLFAKKYSKSMDSNLNSSVLFH